MVINDVLYGSFEINEPVISEIINAEEFQRLKKISQYGPPDDFYHIRNFSRYEHSIGVMLLLRKLNVSLEEQVAGLLHDVSVTTFSHVFDWIVGNYIREDSQDNNHKKFLSESGLAKILDKHGFKIENISNLDNYKFLDSEIPNLCADRLDYSLREINYRFSPILANLLLENLVIHDNLIAFRSKDRAELFGREYSILQSDHWASQETKIRYYIFAKSLDIALKKQIIKLGDFYGTEENILKKIKSANNPNINKLFDILRNKLEFKEDQMFYNLILPKKKFRYVDPCYLEINVGKRVILNYGKLIRLSESDSDYKNFLEEQRKLNEEQKTKIKLLNFDPDDYV